MADKKKNRKNSFKKRLDQKLKFLAGQAIFTRLYATTAVLILLASTILWSLLGAKLNSQNADQLVDPYLFSSKATFHDAIFPSTHTFLLKWPLFWLIKAFGYSAYIFDLVTILLVLTTVGVLVLVIRKIDRRPLIFGTLCLALASVLLMVPAQPYAGALLPVNMAMLATRNLEYALFIGSLILLIKHPNFRNKLFWLGAVGLGLLAASDKLFLAISLGGSLMAVAYYSLRKSFKNVGISSSWLGGSLVAGVGAIIILWLLSALGITHITSSSGASPYSLVHSPKDIALGIVYAFMGILTNFGANPAFDATIVRQIPNHLVHQTFSLSGPAYIVNLLILAFGVFACIKLFWETHKRKRFYDGHLSLALALTWSFIASVAVFIFTDHYYAVDARYLSIVLFTVFVGLALYLSTKKISPGKIIMAGAVIVIGLFFGSISTVQHYNSAQLALKDTRNRNYLIAQILARHQVHTLVGDYWRVLPIKQEIHNEQAVLPLADCLTARTVLTSSAWNTDLKTHSFAYILSLQKGPTGYPACSLDQAINTYGRPNASLLIAGSIEKPKELLLFYDHGIHRSSPTINPLHKDPATVTPISLDELPYTTCDGPTLLNFVAHQDDDILFMNPDIDKDIAAGHCVRTVYLTAGDAGSGSNSFYWISREQGSEAAYAQMSKDNNIWVQRIVKLDNDQFITVANPRSNPKVSLIFMHLPDGNIKGDGFKSSDYESLAKLYEGKINTIHSIDKQSQYSKDQLIHALATLMHIYQPAEVRTQASDSTAKIPEHSDHITVGQLTGIAIKQYEERQFEGRVAVPLTYYMGYPIRNLPANLTDGDLSAKMDAFFQYAKFDGAVCDSMIHCSGAGPYGFYLSREYKN